MRLLSANRLFTETAAEKYQAQPFALAFATGAPPSEVIKNLYVYMFPSPAQPGEWRDTD